MSTAFTLLGLLEPGPSHGYELKRAFAQARKAGRVEKTRDDEENTGHFRLT